jgi:CDP-diglyceride synthetase
MIGGFFAALFMGHVYILVIITAVQIVSFKEVIAIANVPSRARDLQSTKSLNWYWLATTMYFLYGESIVYYLKHIVLVDKVLLPLATHHRFISFILYVFGEHLVVFVTGFVLTTRQASSSSSARSRPATSSFNSRSSPGPTWPCSSSSCRPTSS